MKTKELAKAFVAIMDSEDYEPAKQFLAKDCIYKVGDKIHKGTKAILKTYKEHHDFAKSTFDSVVYKSELSQISDNEFEVTYIDIITYGQKTHTYKCKQFFNLNSENKINEIIHEDIPGEYQRIKSFYEEIGLQRL